MNTPNHFQDFEIANGREARPGEEDSLTIYAMGHVALPALTIGRFTACGTWATQEISAWQNESVLWACKF
jgi:hypothetical protein